MSAISSTRMARKKGDLIPFTNAKTQQTVRLFLDVTAVKWVKV